MSPPVRLGAGLEEGLVAAVDLLVCLQERLLEPVRVGRNSPSQAQ
jgi:hypothetical protein